ncbi:hypothetical protein EHYA_08040 [Embleya hyalina]|uniref:Uncharacterized protein n=1 Tax=Embleya hyalina TaxID=516124 RepID=A0A401Z0C8_9ACTN|nr:hypothetical protein EHYA_08040 [Embleya hyalina]
MPVGAGPATAILGLGRVPSVPPVRPGAFVFVFSLLRIRAPFFIGP